MQIDLPLAWIELAAQIEKHIDLGKSVFTASHTQPITHSIEQKKNIPTGDDRFRLLAKIAPIGIFQTDTDGRIIYHNEMWSFISGQANSIGEFWYSNIINSDRSEIRERWKNDRIRFSCCSYECRFEGNGNPVWGLSQIVAENDHSGKLLGHVGTIIDITTQREHQHQIEKLACYDSLTSLANRQLFRDKLERSLNRIRRNGKKLALLSIDIDHFKRINDYMGHDTGDTLITIIAHRISECVKDNGTVARLGGDDFLICIPDLDNQNQISQLAHSISQAITSPIEIMDQKIIVTASIGIAIAPDDTNDAADIIKCAELAMYESKSKGRNNFQFFVPHMNSRASEKLAMEHDLRTALEKKQFYLCYQPKFRIDNGEIIGCEALIRWQHPVRGEIGPDAFINIAEQTGQIVAIGKYVLEKACCDLKSLQQNQIANDLFTVSVNLSVKQFQTLGLLHTVVATLYENGIRGECIDLEITESIIMENLDQAIQMLHCLKGYGVRISIDDFGTGYSSLGYLKRLPVDAVKIDRSFVRDLPHNKEDSDIVDAIIAMSHKLGLTVVAEGIENEEQLHLLREMGCDYGQGYLVSKPLTLNDLETKLLENAASPKQNKTLIITSHILLQ